jgi:ribosome maturation factor RimP
MGVNDLEETIYNEIEWVIAGMGFSVVECKLGKSKQLNHISIVVFSREGVGSNDCAAISRNIYPRLEMIPGLHDIALQISSPGINRKIKSSREYSIFKGRGVRLLTEAGSDWIRGIIVDFKENILTIEQEQGSLKIELKNIRKARLDYTQEVGK